MAGNLSSANAVIILGITDLFPIAQQIQGFSADDIFSTDPIDTAELVMGVDGKLSAGYVYAMVPQSFTLQADSPSNDFFESWYGAEQVSGNKYSAFGTITLPSIGKVYTMTNGFLSSYPPIADGKKILQPRKYGITWNLITPAISI